MRRAQPQQRDGRQRLRGLRRCRSDSPHANHAHHGQAYSEEHFGSFAPDGMRPKLRDTHAQHVAEPAHENEGIDLEKHFVHALIWPFVRRLLQLHGHAHTGKADSGKRRSLRLRSKSHSDERDSQWRRPADDAQRVSCFVRVSLTRTFTHFALDYQAGEAWPVCFWSAPKANRPCSAAEAAQVCV